MYCLHIRETFMIYKTLVIMKGCFESLECEESMHIYVCYTDVHLFQIYFLIFQKKFSYNCIKHEIFTFLGLFAKQRSSVKS